MPWYAPKHIVFSGVILFLQNLFSDVNECELDLDGCAQNCSNTIGKYYCSCMNGYNLDSDSHSCTGTYVSCGEIPQ